MILDDERMQRLASLHAQMAQQNVDVVAIAPTPNMRYLLGFAPIYDERLCVLLVGRNATQLIVPELNADQVEAQTSLPAQRWTDNGGPRQVLQAARTDLRLDVGTVLAADDTMRADHLLFLQEILSPARSIVASELLAPIRMIKSRAEVEFLARAAAQADRALLTGAEACRPGVTEREVADTITAYFRQDGAEYVDFTIVGSGPNGAFPHHQSGDRPLQVGDMIVIDIGATLNGYKSDVTRMVHLGEPTPEEHAVYDVVRLANERGRAAAVAGVRASDVDRAARIAIEEAGYGQYFFHRLGHGLGMEDHEPPWISAASETIMQPGMVFSIEPGIYLASKFGVRIEDIVVVMDGAPRCLTGLDHALIVRK